MSKGNWNKAQNIFNFIKERKKGDKKDMLTILKKNEKLINKSMGIMLLVFCFFAIQMVTVGATPSSVVEGAVNSGVSEVQAIAFWVLIGLIVVAGIMLMIGNRKVAIGLLVCGIIAYIIIMNVTDLANFIKGLA